MACGGKAAPPSPVMLPLALTTKPLCNICCANHGDVTLGGRPKVTRGEARCPGSGDTIRTLRLQGAVASSSNGSRRRKASSRRRMVERSLRRRERGGRRGRARTYCVVRCFACRTMTSSEEPHPGVSNCDLVAINDEARGAYQASDSVRGSRASCASVGCVALVEQRGLQQRLRGV